MRTIHIVATALLTASLAPLGAVAASAAPAPAPTINQNGVNIHAQKSKDLNDPHEVIARAEKGDTLQAISTCQSPVHGGDIWIHANIYTQHGMEQGVVRSDMIAGLDIGNVSYCTTPAPTG